MMIRTSHRLLLTAALLASAILEAVFLARLSRRAIARTTTSAAPEGEQR